ncbi:MAG: DUF2752 domain-containing protein [Acutalibacteraceae bacterium]|nr:DUF2752 domain-containing protein [Acutalibacteraceae bacterium]
MKKRATKALLFFVALIVGGILYLVVCDMLGFGIPCVFYEITGLKCPGCGATRMFTSLLKGDFISAWNYNSCLLIMLPVIAYFIVKQAYTYIRYKHMNLLVWEHILLSVMIVVLLMFGICRNIVK